jgi:hypothetical protein
MTSGRVSSRSLRPDLGGAGEDLWLSFDWCWQGWIALLGALLRALKGIENGRSFADALRSPSCEVEDSAGSQIFSSQQIDLFLVASSYELGFDGKEECSAWDCYEMECAFLMSLPVKVAAKGRRKKKKCLGLIGEKLDRILTGWALLGWILDRYLDQILG